MQNLLFVSFEEDGHHGIVETPLLSPVAVREIVGNVLLVLLFVFLNNELIKRVVQDSLKDPLL